MRLVVKKLFGKYDYDITFDKKMNVLIGENGTGKSTLLKIIGYILSKDYIQLSKIKFDHLFFECQNKKMTIYHTDLVQNPFTKDNNFIFALNEYLTSDNLFKIIGVDTIDEMIEKLNGDKCIMNLFDCGGIFSTILEGIKEYCIKRLNYNTFTIDSYNIEDYFEFDKSIFNISDSDKKYINLYDNFYDNYCEYNFVYGSNMYLKRLFIFFVLLKRDLDNNPSKIQMINEINEMFDEETISMPVAFHNFVKYKDNFSYPLDCTCFENKVDFYSLLSDLILESATDESLNKKFTSNDYKKLHNICKEYRKNVSDGRGLIFTKNLLDFENGLLLDISDKIIDKRKDPFDVFEKKFGSNIEIKFDKRRTNGKIYISKKTQILDPLVWFHRTFKDEIYDNVSENYNFYSCAQNLLDNYGKLMSFKNNNYLNFKTLFSKYFVNKSVDIIGDDIEILDIKTCEILNECCLSSGEYKLLRILKMLCFSDENTILLLDEPELSLSIYWQEMLLEDILRYSKAKQIIIATQSPNLINEDQLEYLIEVKKEKGE